MHKGIIRFTSTLLSVLLSVSALGGCSKTDKKTAESTGAPSTGTADSSSLLPVKKPVTIKYWVDRKGVIVVNNFNEVAMFKELEERTGVKVEFIHPSAGQEKAQINLLIASKDLPDIIDQLGSYYPGGLVKALQDGIIIDQKDLLQKYAPNLTNIYKTFPEVKRDVETEEGQYLQAPWIAGGSICRMQWGGIMRKDWLDELGMKAPTNIDEWYTVLKGFKDKMKAKVPLVATTSHLKSNYFAGPFDIITDYFVDNGKVKYGPYDAKYKNYLNTMVKWYKEGLIDAEFPNSKTETIDARILNNEAGAYYAAAGSGFGKYFDPMKAKNPKFDLVAVEPPSHKIFPITPLVNAAGSSITSACKEKEIVMQWLDYGYSKEGHMLNNFGPEGVSYNMVNGYPTYTDLIVKNPDGQPMSTIGRKYFRAFYSNGATIQDTRNVEQFFQLPQQKEAGKAWSKYANEKANFEVKGSLTAEESQAISAKQTEIDTYVNEMFLKFVMGVVPISDFDQYTAQLKKMGIEDTIKIKQGAYDRYVKKFPDALKQGGSVEITDKLYK